MKTSARRQIDPNPQFVDKEGMHPGKIDQRKLPPGRDIDEDIEIAVFARLVARSRAEQEHSLGPASAESTGAARKFECGLISRHTPFSHGYGPQPNDGPD